MGRIKKIELFGNDIAISLFAIRTKDERRVA